MRDLRGARVLVTGAGGFIGSHLTRRLLEAGADVHAMSPAVSTQTPPRLADVAADVTLVEANVTDRTSMEHVAGAVGPEFVLHLAAFTHVGKSFVRVDECLQTNVQGTVNLLQALDGDYERFVCVGTSEIYGPVEAPFREDRPVDPVGRDVAIRDLATTILGLMDEPIEPRFGALDHRPTEVWRMVGDPSKGRELLGWEAQVDLEAGLERTIAWHRDHADQLHTAGSVSTTFPATVRSGLQGKPRLDDHRINGGFMVVERRAVQHWDGTDLEIDVLPGLADLGVLHTYEHDGSWRSMDTAKDRLELEDLAAEQQPPPWMP